MKFFFGHSNSPIFIFVLSMHSKNQIMFFVNKF